VLYQVPCGCTALDTNTTAWNTCCHNTAKLLTIILLIILQKCNISKDQRRLPEDGPDGPKHVRANAYIF
jgi:hypothetical protein